VLTKETGGDRSYEVRHEGDKILVDGQRIDPSISDRCF
jgi:hypothetical protein